MAIFTVWRCDLCGGESRAPEHHKRTASYFGIRTVDNLDLCQDCYQKLMQFFDSLRNNLMAK